MKEAFDRSNLTDQETGLLPDRWSSASQQGLQVVWSRRARACQPSISMEGARKGHWRIVAKIVGVPVISVSLVLQYFVIAKLDELDFSRVS